MSNSYRLASLTNTRFEGDVIEEFVRHTLRFVDRMFVIDNVAPDRTREILDRLVAEGLPVTIWESFELDDLTGDITRFARRAFAEDACDYLFVLDADEFLRPAGRDALERSLALLPAEAHATLPWVTYVPTWGDVASDSVLASIRYRMADEPIAFSKIIVARSFANRPSAEIAPGFHGITDTYGDPAVVPLADAAIAHFPVRSIPQLQGKAFLGWSSFLLVGNEDSHTMGAQWRRLYEELRRDADWTPEDLYYFARTYLDIGRTNPDLVFDPMPTVERRYPFPVPPMAELALTYIQSLSDYCLRLRGDAR